jgi:hypothetical protein
MAPQIVTVNDVLDGHVALDIECLDRIYLNAYVPIFQTSAQVVAFLSGHLSLPFPSPVLFRQLGTGSAGQCLPLGAFRNAMPAADLIHDRDQLVTLAHRRSPRPSSR